MKTGMGKMVLGAAVVASMGLSVARAEQSMAALLRASGIKGGLVVHIGCGDGRDTSKLGGGGRFLVHGLDTDPEKVAAARAHFRSLGRDGTLSATVFDGTHLPYADSLVNLIVVASGPSSPVGSAVASEWQVAREEIARVLAPRGVLMLSPKAGSAPPDLSPLATRHSPLEGEWRAFQKPVPKEIDDWPHYLHGPNNNAVAEDAVVGPPHHYQWIGGPRFSRSHDHLASVTAMVSSGGRVFSIVDEGSIAFVASRAKWRLVAQDAFNGIRLWERDVGPWAYHLRDFRSGPVDVARRLVAAEDCVYVTLGYGKPVVALDAATGRTLRTYDGTEGTSEILLYEDMLLLVLGEPHKEWGAQQAKEVVSQTDYSPPFEKYAPPLHAMRVMAVSASTGKTLWSNAESRTLNLMPSTLTADAGRVFFQNADAVVCLDAKTGKHQWDAPRPMQRQRLAWSTPTVVACDGVVYSADRGAAKRKGELLWLPSGGYHQYIRGEEAKGELIAFDAETGERMWSCEAYEGFNSPVDVLISDGLLWTGQYAWGNDPGVTEARDPRTGEVRRKRPPDSEFLPRIGHARCHRAKATPRYLMLGRRGIECVDLKTGDMIANLWVRGICQYGVMPANGLIYVPPHACGCNVNDMLKSGFMALAPARRDSPSSRPRRASDGERLDKGPAYGSIANRQSAIGTSPDWPTYRGNARRGGALSTPVPAELATVWRASVGGKLSAPVVGGGTVVVAQKGRHAVHALDVATGRSRWTYVAGGRIDSPPTLDSGRVLFGSADGRVTCLDLADGRTAWTFRAAPRERLIVANGQLESAWPVSGSVLVVDNAVYFASGRTTYLDGGMWLYKLDAATGRVLRELKLEADPEKRDAGIAKGGHLPDVLSSDGESVFIRHARFDMELERQKDSVPHLWSSVGFLDDSWWHRTYWQIGTSMGSGWGGWSKAGRSVPAGRLLVAGKSRVYGYGRNQYDIPGAHVGVDGRGAWGPVGKGQSPWTYYRLFGRELETAGNKPRGQKAAKKTVAGSDWSCRIPVVGRALVLAGDTLFVAGPVDPVSEVPHEPTSVDPVADALESGRGGRLLAVSARDGKTVADLALKHPPVFDGMAAAGGCLFLATKGGDVVCMGKKGE